MTCDCMHTVPFSVTLIDLKVWGQFGFAIYLIEDMTKNMQISKYVEIAAFYVKSS